MTCCTFSRIRLKDLNVWLASFKAILVERVKSHVVVAACALSDISFAGLALSLASVTFIIFEDTQGFWTLFVAVEIEVVRGLTTIHASGTICSAHTASGTSRFAWLTHILTWLLDVSGSTPYYAIGISEMQIISYTAACADVLGTRTRQASRVTQFASQCFLVVVASIRTFRETRVYLQVGPVRFWRREA